MRRNVHSHSLDQLSTSQTSGAFPRSGLSAEFVLCSYNAPFIAYKKEGKMYGITQGCCNHWDCERCGQHRAKMEYGRIVSGVQTLAKTRSVAFITITCKGKHLSVRDAEANYLEWTNRLLTNLRTYTKRNGQHWDYVQVTEKQKRGHPHSHILTTFVPPDIYHDWVYSRKYTGDEIEESWKWSLRSDWLQKSIVSAGLGDQYDISLVQTAAAASRYVAKYMFKDSMFGTHWPKGWKRVRYSQSFPKLPDRAGDAFVLLSKMDWRKLAGLASVIVTDNDFTKREALYFLAGHDILIG
jgi:hypothetical protein